jgi:hypothetical protein
LSLAVLGFVSIEALPVARNQNDRAEDLLGAEQPIQFNPADLISFFVRLLEFEEQLLNPRSGGGNFPAQLLSLANTFLGGLSPGRNDVRDDSFQDPRVLNYDQEINRRNQLGRLARVFSSFLFR